MQNYDIAYYNIYNLDFYRYFLLSPQKKRVALNLGNLLGDLKIVGGSRKLKEFSGSQILNSSVLFMKKYGN